MNISRTKRTLKYLHFVKYKKIEDVSLRILNLFVDLALLKDGLNFDGRSLKRIFPKEYFGKVRLKRSARGESCHPAFMGKCPTINLTF